MCLLYNVLISPQVSHLSVPFQITIFVSDYTFLRIVLQLCIFLIRIFLRIPIETHR